MNLKEMRQFRRPLVQLRKIKLRVLTSTKQIDDSGKYVVKSSYVTYDPVEKNKNRRASDFELDSLLAVGADLTLSSLSMDNHQFVDDISAKLAQFENNPNNFNNL